jgi:hypothetical protein
MRENHLGKAFYDISSIEIALEPTGQTDRMRSNTGQGRELGGVKAKTPQVRSKSLSSGSNHGSSLGDEFSLAIMVV